MKVKKGSVVLGIAGALFIIVFFGGILVLLMGFDQVDADKIGVKERFGVVLGRMDPGLQWTGFFVGVTEYPMTIQKMVLERIEAVDVTGQSVFATIVVNYRIKGVNIPVLLYQEVGTNGNMPFIEERLAVREKVEESFKQVTVGYRDIEIIENRDDVRTKTIERIKELFPNRYFEIVSITVSNIDFAPSFNDAIQLKKDNTQLALAAEEKVRQITAEANQKIEQARGEAESKKLNAEAEAFSLKVKAREITDQMIMNNWIDRWNGNVPQWYFAGSGGDSPNLLIQIPEVSKPIGNSGGD